MQTINIYRERNPVIWKIRNAKKTLRLTKLLCGTPTFVRGTCAFIKWIMCPLTNYVYEMRNTVKCEAEIMNIAFYWYWLRSDLDKLVGETNVFIQKNLPAPWHNDEHEQPSVVNNRLHTNTAVYSQAISDFCSNFTLDFGLTFIHNGLSFPSTNNGI